MKAVLFDMGRVLVHYDHQTTMASTAALWDVPLAALRDVMQEVGDALGIGDMDAEAFHKFLSTRFGLATQFEPFLAAFGAGIQRDEAALAYALSLQARPGVTVAVISNTNDAHVRWLDELVPELQEFDLVMMSNEVGLAKPDPAIFETALELLELAPQQTIFVDDSAANVAAARALGMAGIVHTDWAETRPQLDAWLAAA